MNAAELYKIALAWARVDRVYGEATRGRAAGEPPSGLTEAELEKLSREMDDHDEKLFEAARALLTAPPGMHVGASGRLVCDACGTVEDGNINCAACVGRWPDDELKTKMIEILKTKEG